jgi:hypothetical protein
MKKKEIDEDYEAATAIGDESYRKSRKRAIEAAEKAEREEEEINNPRRGSVASDALKGYEEGKTLQPIDDPAYSSTTPDSKWDFKKKETPAPSNTDAERLSDLMKRYREASAKKRDSEQAGFFLTLFEDNPQMVRERRNAMSAANDESLNAIERELEGTKKSNTNESDLITLARRRALLDPNSPIAKALSEYEAKTRGFGEGVSGLSGQDFIDAGKTVAPTFAQQQQTLRTQETNQSREREGKADRSMKVSEGEKERVAKRDRAIIAARKDIAKAALGQEEKSASGAAKAGAKAVEGASELNESQINVLREQPKYKDPKYKNATSLVPKTATPQQKNRMREITEFTGKSLTAMRALQEALRDPKSNRFERLFDVFKSQSGRAGEQFRAYGLQADTKINDNGVVNPADLTLGGKALMGMNPDELRSIFVSNPEFADQLEVYIQNTMKGFADSVGWNGFEFGNADEAKAAAEQGYRSSTQPNYSLDPQFAGELGLVPNQPATPPNKPTTPPNQSATPMDPRQAEKERIKAELRARKAQQ